jgi:hypothetical protein
MLTGETAVLALRMTHLEHEIAVLALQITVLALRMTVHEHVIVVLALRMTLFEHVIAVVQKVASIRINTKYLTHMINLSFTFCVL